MRLGYKPPSSVKSCWIGSTQSLATGQPSWIRDLLRPAIKNSTRRTEKVGRKTRARYFQTLDSAFTRTDSNGQVGLSRQRASRRDPALESVDESEPVFFFWEEIQSLTIKSQLVSRVFFFLFLNDELTSTSRS